MRFLMKLAVFILIMVVTLKVGLSRWIDAQVQNALHQNCPDCSAVLNQVGFFPPRLIFNDFHFSSGNPKATLVEADVKEIILNFSRAQLLEGKFFLTEIIVIAPRVMVTEGDLLGPRGGNEDSGKGFREAASHIKEINISDASFTYSRVHGGRSGQIRLKKITGKMEVESQEVTFFLDGQLESSAEFAVKLQLPRTFLNIDLDLNLKISKLNLVDLNTYFNPSEGMLLTGSLYEGESQVRIRNNALKGWVDAKYLGLDVQFEKTKERSAVSTFFLNLGKSMKLKSKNIDQKKSDQIRAVGLKRLQDETVFHFIFRGMGKAALKIAF